MKPQIIGSSTMVPVRAILEAMGYTVSYDSKTGVIKAVSEKETVIMTIGSKTIKTAKGISEAAVAPVIINGRTLIPLRALGESTGYTVKWDAATQTATLDK